MKPENAIERNDRTVTIMTSAPKPLVGKVCYGNAVYHIDAEGFVYKALKPTVKRKEQFFNLASGGKLRAVRQSFLKASLGIK